MRLLMTFGSSSRLPTSIAVWSFSSVTTLLPYHTLIKQPAALIQYQGRRRLCVSIATRSPKLLVTHLCFLIAKGSLRHSASAIASCSSSLAITLLRRCSALLCMRFWFCFTSFILAMMRSFGISNTPQLWAQCPLTELCCFLMGPNSYQKVVKIQKKIEKTMS